MKVVYVGAILLLFGYGSFAVGLVLGSSLHESKPCACYKCDGCCCGSHCEAKKVARPNSCKCKFPNCDCGKGEDCDCVEAKK